MQQKGYDLKINVSSSDWIPPKSKGYSNVWFNLFGMKESSMELVQYMAQICQDNPKAKKLIINANEKIKKELRIFSEIHGVIFVK